MMSDGMQAKVQAAPAAGPSWDGAAEVIEDARISRFDLAASAGEAGTWRIQLARPAAPPPASGYPVIYLLDGNATFPLMWKAALAADVPVAFVGIGYPVPQRFDVTRRYYDLTSAVPPETMRGRDGGAPPRTGGRAAFLDFIGRDLLPEVARRLPADPGRRMLFGHSLGGLFVLFALFARPAMFRAYVAADPSIWWGGRAILRDQAAFLADAARRAGPIDLLVETSSGGSRSGAPASPKRNVPNADGPGPREVAAALSGVPGLRVFHRHFATLNHGAMLPFNVADALAFASGRLPQDAVGIGG